MIANSLIYVRCNAWLLKSEYTLSLLYNQIHLNDVIFKIITNISSTLLSEIDNCI